MNKKRIFKTIISIVLTVSLAITNFAGLCPIHVYAAKKVVNDSDTLLAAINNASTDPEYSTITFASNGGSGTMDLQFVQNGVDIALTANSFTLEGYSFDGWNTSQDGSGTSYSDGDTINISSDITLYAQWKILFTFVSAEIEAPNSVLKGQEFTVTYKYIFSTSPSSAEDRHNGAGQIGIESSDYAEWVGNPTALWNENVYFWIRTYKATETGSFKFTAYFENVERATKTITAKEHYTITFDSNGEGATISQTSADIGKDGKLTSLPTLEWKGHVFDGWYSLSTGGEEITTSTVFTADDTIYAHWHDDGIVNVNITFKVKNGSWNDNSTEDKTINLWRYENEDKALILVASDIPGVGEKPESGYADGFWDVDPPTDKNLGNERQNLTYTYTYKEKAKKSAKVTFKVVNGSWNDGTKEDKTVMLTGHEGDTLMLSADQIPGAGTKPYDKYKEGLWDITPSSATEITKDITYTYTYEKQDITIVPEPVQKDIIVNLKSVKQKSNKVQVSWSRVKEADGYDVYVHYCKSKAKKPAKTIKKNSVTTISVNKIDGKKINLKEDFHVYVVAYKMVDGKKVTLAKTVTAHFAGTKSADYTNPKALKLTKSSYSIKAGKTANIKAKVTLADKKKKHLPAWHAAKFRYKSYNKKIATVDKNGKIKGKKKGTCYIYVYTINGLMKKVKVTVSE